MLSKNEGGLVCITGGLSAQQMAPGGIRRMVV